MHQCTLQQGRFRASYRYYDDGTPDSVAIEEVFDDHGKAVCALVTEFVGITDLADVIRRLDRLASEVIQEDRGGDSSHRHGIEQSDMPF